MTRRDLYKTRRTFVTHGLANGENPGWAAKMLGRTTLLMRMTRYYRYIPNLTRQDGTLLSAIVATTTYAQTTITKQIAPASDDAEEEGPTGTTPNKMWLNSTHIELVTDIEPASCGVQKIGLRFTAMSIPAGATITDAYLTFRAIAADAPMTNSEATSLTIKGQLIADAPTFTSTSGNISGRTTTSASFHGCLHPGRQAQITIRPA